MNIMDTHIIFGKNSRGYVFQCKFNQNFWSSKIFYLDKTLDKGGQTTTDENALKKMIFTLREYEERNKKLESQISKYETELYGKSADKYASIQVFSRSFYLFLK